jgi:hypothetical protein
MALKCVNLLKKRSTRFLKRYRKGLKAGILTRRGIGHGLVQQVAIVGGIAEKNLALGETAEHVAGALAVMGLALGQLQGDRIGVGVDEGMDLGRQPTSRAPHASGSRFVLSVSTPYAMQPARRGPLGLHVTRRHKPRFE